VSPLPREVIYGSDPKRVGTPVVTISLIVINTLQFLLASADNFGDAFFSGAHGQKRFDKKVQGNGGIPLFHFGDPGLAGIELPGQFQLRQTALFAFLGQGLAQGQFHFNVGGFLRAEPKEILGVPDPVILGFKLSFFILVHN